MITVSQEEFEQAIEEAIDSIPVRFLEELENIVFIAEDEPTAWQLERRGGTYDPKGASLLGLYDGVNLLNRGTSYGAVSDYPDTITIFKKSHERLCNSKEQLFEEVRRTVVHEVGHYFGMTEEQVAKMGYA